MARIPDASHVVRPELVAYASSREELELFVNSGADAVIVKYKSGAERVPRGCFSRAELSDAVRYCRVRGVKVYAYFERLYSDGELPSLIREFEAVCSCGVDAVRLRDPGAAFIARQMMPRMPLHACGGLCLEDGLSAPLAKKLGFARVCLGPSARLDRISPKGSPEFEVSALSPGCSAAAGICYLSSFVDAERCGIDCRCVCRQPFGRNRRGLEYPLCARPVCLVEHLEELSSRGFTSLLLDCRELAPKLAAVVIASFFDAASGQLPNEKLLRSIRSACGTEQLGSGFLFGKDASVFYASEPPSPPSGQAAPSDLRAPQLRRVDVYFLLRAESGRPLTLTAADRDGNIACAEGSIVYSSVGRAEPEATYRTLMYRTGETPFVCSGVKMSVEKGCSIDIAELARLRDRTLLQLTAIRGNAVRRPAETFIPGSWIPHDTEKNLVAVELSRREQLSEELAALSFDMLYLPLGELCSGGRLLEAFRSRSCSEICAVMPRLPSADMLPHLRALLTSARESGVTRVLCGDLSGASLALSEGFRVRGDWNLNICSTMGLRWLKEYGFESCVPSLLISFEQIKKLSRELEIEVFAYGRIPLMVTQLCVDGRRAGEEPQCGGRCLLKDRRNMPYPVMKDPSGEHCIVYDRRKLTVPTMAELSALGADVLRLHFTGENSNECVRTVSSFLEGRPPRPNGYTYGRYIETKRGLLSRLQRGRTQ